MFVKFLICISLFITQAFASPIGSGLPDQYSIRLVRLERSADPHTRIYYIGGHGYGLCSGCGGFHGGGQGGGHGVHPVTYLGGHPGLAGGYDGGVYSQAYSQAFSNSGGGSPGSYGGAFATAVARVYRP